MVLVALSPRRGESVTRVESSFLPFLRWIETWRLDFGDLAFVFGLWGLEFRRSFMGTLPVPVWWDPWRVSIFWVCL